ncbi:MAG: 30S ribosomal protein S13, small subunit ribosomal protein S13 [Candidatus Peregrinibacteria bacterium GW2011_GWC2_33_13]|nr:MAG: 30S ribosomal protein S13, small subunit ribosomal protein S13 [Candidatus Peregrinibacteria bacterium GW2011_GWC2_33_13]
MARISGINLPKDKRIEAALTLITGIGRSLSKKVLTSVNIDLDKKVKDLSENEVIKIQEEVNKFAVEGDLRRKVAQDIKRLQEIGSYRGYRHRRKLPVRGQRTKTNARTKRGKKVTMGSGKRKEQKK